MNRRDPIPKSSINDVAHEATSVVGDIAGQTEHGTRESFGKTVV